MKTTSTQAPIKPKRQANEGFWKTAKGRALLAARQSQEERDTWRRFDAWS